MLVRCYRSLAINARYSLQKGDPVVVVGRLRVESYVSDAGVPRESTVLNALAVGHDLNMGTTKFDRGERRRQPEPAAPRFEGEVVDPETGEIVDLANCDAAAEVDDEASNGETVPEEMEEMVLGQ